MWFDVIKVDYDDKKKIEHQLGAWMALLLDEGYFYDSIYMDDRRFPEGRPWNTNTGRVRIFLIQNERDWIKEQAEAGTPQSISNPYYAPATHPDEYADFSTKGGDLKFIAGSKKFWDKAYATMEWFD
tara:strand:+ start:258 stop:638 length:381 start_codon:yes stop_codon:yes gene_type:complete